MPEDYYSDAAAPAEPPPAPEEDTTDNSSTAELPKAILGGKECKPGEEIKLKVVKVMEDSVLVKFAGYDEEKDMESAETAPDAEAAPPPAPGGGGMGSMYE